jgi:outer membrane protein assembly factor BamB
MDPDGNIFLATLDDWDDTESEWDDLQLAVYKFAPTSSAWVWKFNDFINIQRNRVLSATVVDYERGQIYVGISKDSEGSLYALNWSDGSRKFVATLPKGIVATPALGVDGTIYAGCLDGKLYAIDWVTAAIKWSFLTGADYVFGSPTVDAAGNIYIGDSDGVLHAVAPGGQELWRFSSNSNIASAPAIGNNGTLYLTSYDGSVYAIGAPTQRYWRGLPRRNSPTPRERP